MTFPPKTSFQFGLISDTHGHLPAGTLDVFRSVDAILHAGDIGSDRILSILEEVAPLVAVRGNMDWGPWAESLAEKEAIQAGSHVIFLIHDLSKLNPKAIHTHCLAVINGHTHRPLVEMKNGVLFVNPGSAGAPRRGEPPCVALLSVSGQHVSADLINLRG